MIVVPEQRFVDSPYVAWIGHGYTAADGLTMSPAEYNWHLIFTRQEGRLSILVVGAREAAQPLQYTADAESLWIRFNVGTSMAQQSAPDLLNRQTSLPDAGDHHFWLNGRVWEVPNFQNADIFVERLARTGTLTYDPLIDAALRDELPHASERTIRHHFQHSTGLRQNDIRQMQRAEKAQALLQQGKSIVDTAQELGYADQPHLTRSLKRFLGYTPRELLAVPAII